MEVTIDVSRIKRGVPDEWFCVAEKGVDTVVKNWGDSVPSIFWFKYDDGEVAVVCYEKHRVENLHKLIKYKYKERRDE